MNKGNDFGLDIQAKSSNDLMRQYKVKLENAKSSKESTKSLVAGKLDHYKQSLAAGNAIPITRPTQIQHKKQNQRKQGLNNIAAVQPILEPSKKIDEQNNSWKALKKEPIWDYVNQKYIIAEKGKKAVYATINDAWRRYKCFIKKEHFSKYKNLQERLKNRPQEIPEADFRVLVEYWRLEATQEISNQNTQNIAQLKWRHQAGPISFARIREKLRASNEDKVPPTQAEVFIATRQSKKGKGLGQETNNAIIKLNDLIENSGQSSSEAFHCFRSGGKPKK